MKETWKPVPGYEGLYEVSDLGRVKSLITGIFLSLNRKDIRGYPQVALCKKGEKAKTYKVHKLVYIAFIGKIPTGLQVNHINEEKEDNRLCNLNLMTPSENVNWGTRNERVAEALSKPVIAYNKKTGKFFKEFKSLTEAAILLRIHGAESGICKCLKGKRRSAYGYVWKYV